MAIITISRQIGSGGDEIAARLAKELRFTLVDHTLLVELLKAQGLSKSDVEALDEAEFGEARQDPEQDRVYVDLLPTLITDLAAEKNLVVLGRGGQCIFRGFPGALHVRVVANAKERARRLMGQRGIEAHSAVRLIEESDEARRRFIQYHYGEDIDAVAHYDLVINADRLNVEVVTRLIQLAAEMADLMGKGQEIGRWLETARPFPFAHPSEEEFAKVLDFYQIRWEYEPRTFPLAWDEAGNAAEAFSPDFYLVDFDLFIELTTLKQSLVTEKNRKIRRFRELYPEVALKVFYGRDYRSLLAKYGLAKRGSSK
ncbi:cytidylate kinase family protein [Candidatus Methylomirabilis sp.]|uniref:Cytidylate kinase family protein n=1 Tax=Candidatus Methylomirabilis tolerans TaxID=3123416 RepID=A0AAJ1ERV3_9BACT|nr:cytidylate kinase family protein [Candidatus Methylomirabilis sp.]